MNTTNKNGLKLTKLYACIASSSHLDYVCGIKGVCARIIPSLNMNFVIFDYI